MRFLVRLVVNAVALWLTTLIVSGVTVTPFGDGDTTAVVLTFLLVAFVFGLVNAVIGTIIRIVAFPLYVLTLGLISLIINGFLLWLTAAITSGWDWGLRTGEFWLTVVAALLIGIINAVLGGLLRRDDDDD